MTAVTYRIRPRISTACRIFPILYKNQKRSPQIVPSLRDPSPHLTHGSFGPPNSTSQTASQNRFNHFSAAHSSDHRQTDRHTYKSHCFCSNRPQSTEETVTTDEKTRTAADTKQMNSTDSNHDIYTYTQKNCAVADRERRRCDETAGR